MPTIAWGHNPGQFAVKDTFESATGTRKESTPYPAVIAPYAQSDDMGLGRSTTLEATVNGARYIGGAKAARLPTASREMSKGRLDEDSIVYSAFAQMSLQHTKLRPADDTNVVIATALPVGWRNEDTSASDAIERHIRSGLRGKIAVKNVYVRSEPAAVIYHELLTDTGDIRRDQQALAKGVVCVADIGGGTLNRSVLENIEALPGQSHSPLLGSRRAIDLLMQSDGVDFVDAERRLRTAVEAPGRDAAADRVINQYRQLVVGELQQAWSVFRTVEAYLFAGGTSFWLAPALLKAFGARARIVDRPQQAIATGLFRYAKRQIARGK